MCDETNTRSGSAISPRYKVFVWTLNSNRFFILCAWMPAISNDNTLPRDSLHVDCRSCLCTKKTLNRRDRAICRRGGFATATAIAIVAAITIVAAIAIAIVAVDVVV